ncbi:MAG: hypothetical protein AAB582_02355 [Patescibacteria group bacterium]
MRTLILLIFGFCIPLSVSAATVSFEPQASTAGIDGPFVIAVNLSADTYINALDIRLMVPHSLEPIDVSDGNSIINLWLEEPHFDETTRILSFSGIIPQGFMGEQGRLLTITMRPALLESSAELELDPVSAAYAGEGEKVALTALSLKLPVVATRGNIANPIPDTDPPEAFTPIVVREEHLYEGAPVLLFSTVDKGSGIARYEVKESWFGNVFPSTGWRLATSPYPLRDGERASHIYVRAIDKTGNSSVEHMQPERIPTVMYVVPLIAILSMLVFWYVRQMRARR